MKTAVANLAEAPKMYETENDISLKRRSELNALMNQRLASAVDLQMQMKQAHWNVKGPSFIGLHELFDKVDEAVESYVDMIAERIVQLGGIAEGTVRVSAARSRTAWLMSKPLPVRFPPSDKQPAARLRKRTPWTMPTRRICSPKSRAALINGFGSSKPIPKRRNKKQLPPHEPNHACKK